MLFPVLHILFVVAAAASQLIYNFNDHGVAFGEELVSSLDLQPSANEFENLTDFKVDQFSLLSLHKSLIDIKSLSSYELAVAFYLEKYLTAAGLTVELQKVPVESNAPARFNVYAYLGSKRNTTVLLTSHIDTVPPYIPYKIVGDKIYGRGSCDAKGSVATQILAFLSLYKSGAIKEGDLSLLFVVGEEVGGAGMKHAGDHLNVSWETGIFGEPTENLLGVGHKGAYKFQLFAHGKAGHSGYPQLYVSASEILLPVLSKLLTLDFPKDDLLGPTTLNIGQVDIGVASNVIPGNGFADVFLRVASDLEKVDEIIHSVVDDVENLTFEFQIGAPPTYLDYDVPTFDSVVLAYSTDVPNLLVPLKKRYLYGPGTITVAHADNENVDNQSLLDAIDGYIRLVKYSLGHKID